MSILKPTYFLLSTLKANNNIGVLFLIVYYVIVRQNVVCILYWKKYDTTKYKSTACFLITFYM